MAAKTAAEALETAATPSTASQDLSSIETTAADVSETPADVSESHSALTTIEELPNELLSNIFGYLDTPHPSASKLHDEPTFDLTLSAVADLKAVSKVSKRWRQAVLQLLFRHARLVVTEPVTQSHVLNEQIQPFLDFINQKSLSKIVISFALCILDKKFANNSDGKYRLNDFSMFWHIVFSTIDPLDLAIVAPAQALGSLTSCHVYTVDAWSFDCPYHILRLQKPAVVASSVAPTTDPAASGKSAGESSSVPTAETPTIAQISEVTGQSMFTEFPAQDPLHASASSSPVESWMIPRTPAEYSTLFQIRPWSTLLLNEGSFLKAYSTYEFFLKQPPSILPDLVGAEALPHKALISPTIRDMSYIGIFPMASHFSGLTKNCPRLDRLYVQLVPRNDILDNEEKMKQVDTNDLWMERNSCYALLMRELFHDPPTDNYQYLQIFESGDAADADAWHMAVEFVKRAGVGWKIAGDGVFTRSLEDVEAEASREPGEGNHTPLLGQLRRWAFNGITRLPVSASNFYGRPLGPLDEDSDGDSDL